MQLLIPLGEAGMADRGLVGSKARELGRLLSEGTQVPDGFVITTAARSSAVDDEVSSELMALVGEAMRAHPGPLAFRSSAVAEDLGHASYAGQYDTVLGVEGMEQAAAAIKACWKSADSEAVTAYRGGHGDSDAGIAVLVQRMVDADVAGVAFTTNPVTGADEVVIEAVRGLGEALMSGDVTPERWLARSEPELVTPGEAGGVLTAERAGEVAEVSRGIAQRRGVPQDIEWAYEGDSLQILQARSITALPQEPVGRPPKGQSWARDDAYFPDPITQLTFSAWLPYHSAAFARVTRHLGLPFERIDHGLYLGRVYDRAVPLGEPKKDRPLPPALLLKLALRLAPPFRKRMKIAVASAAEDRPIEVIEAWEAGGRDALRARTRQLREVDRSQLSDGELAEHLDEVRAQVLQVATDHFMLGMAGTFVLAGQLGLVVEEILGWPADRVIDLVQGYGDATVADGAAMDALSAAIAADPEATRLLAEDPARVLDHRGPGGDALREFLDHNGHRLLSPRLDLATWAEDPTSLLRMLAARVGHAGADGDRRAVAREAEAEARAQIEDPADLERFENALARARLGRPYADETEPDTGDILAVVRYIALEAGARLASAGVIPTPDDVMYLTVDELGDLLRGDQAPDDLARRRAEHRWALANPTPESFGPPPGDMPPIDVFPARTRPIFGAALWALQMFFAPARDAEEGGIVGLAASPGRATGPVRIIASPEEFDRVRPGDIMVCRHTMAAWSPIFPVLGGLITEQGGPLSHPGTLAREYALPAVLSVKSATELFAEGQIITIDGGTGRVEV